MKKKYDITSVLKGKRFYAVLSVFVVAAVVTSGLAVNRMTNNIKLQEPEVKGGESWQEKSQDANKPQEKQPILPATPSPSPKSQPSGSLSGEQSAKQDASQDGTGQQTSSFVLPVNGQITAAYSGDELMYNETLADWRTHNGLDITVSTGAEVVAATSGTVTAIREDALWGTVIEILTGDDTIRYCGLDKDVKVGEGAMVKAGDLIGKIGEIPAESSLEPHLHFEVLENGNLVDPESIMK